MPSPILLRAKALTPPMGLVVPPSFRHPDPLIGTWSDCATGAEMPSLVGGYTSQTYPAASRVLAFQFCLAEHYLVRKVWRVNTATATTDSFDVGVYTEDGATLLVSGGSTAIATANVVQEKDCTDTLLVPGRYWCAHVQGGVTATVLATSSTASVGALRCVGLAQMAGSGSTLGSTFTPAALASSVFPLFGISNRTQVA